MNKERHALPDSQSGSSTPLIIAIVFLSVLLVAAVGGFAWAYLNYTDWKTKGEAKIAEAVKTAKNEQQAADTKTFTEQQKKPNLTYKSSADMGSVEFAYPKTWSAYTATTTGSTDKLQVYFYPHVVPYVQDGVFPYALRLKVSREDYPKVLRTYESLAKSGKVKVNTLTVGKTQSFKGYEGVRVDGQLTQTINGSVAIFKVRDKTLQVFVDSKDYINDFDNTILKSLKFTP